MKLFVEHPFFFLLMYKPYTACHTILHFIFMAHLWNWALVSHWIRCAKNFLYKYSQSCEKISERSTFYSLFLLENLKFFRIFIFSIIRASQRIQNFFTFLFSSQFKDFQGEKRASRYYSRLLENCLNDWKEIDNILSILEIGEIWNNNPYYPAITSTGDLALL